MEMLTVTISETLLMVLRVGRVIYDILYRTIINWEHTCQMSIGI